MAGTVSPMSLASSFGPNGHAPAPRSGSAKSRSPTGTASSAGSKRKRAPEEKFYAVRIGHNPGVYYTWADCLAQVKGFKKATYKSFSSFTDAESFVAGTDPSLDPSSSSFGQAKFYAVQRGRVPGVYSDWPSAQQQIIGWTKPRHRCFSTRAEAEDFVREAGGATESVDAGPPSSQTKKGEQSTLSFATQSPALAGPAGPAGKGNEKGTKKPRKSNKGTKGVPDAAVATGLQQPFDPTVPQQAFEPGMGPLPPDAEDDFDTMVTLDPHTGHIEWKSEPQRRKTILQPNGPKPDSVLRIYTDGSSLKNGQGGAVGGIGVYFGDGDPRNLSEPLMGSRQTNNRAELTAIVRALDIAPRNREVCIFTDSSYSVHCVTEWVHTWRRNNWTLSNHKPVENRDLIEAILAKMDERQRFGARTTFQWLRGHNKDHGNTQADRLAVNGAKNARP